MRVARGGRMHTFADFTGGLNTRDAPYELEPNEARGLVDVVPLARGAIRKRKGSTTFATPAVALNSLHPLNAAAKWLVGAGGTKLYKIDAAGAPADLKAGLTNGLRWEFVQAPASGGQGQLFGLNGTDTPQQWDGVAASSSDWTASAGAVPNGKYMVVAGNRVWVAGVAAAPNDLFFCEIGDPRNWPAANVVRFDPNDGGEITGIGVVGPYVVVFKERKVFLVYDLDTGANRPLSNSVGCVGHRSIAPTERGTFFLSPDGVYRTDGSKVELISDKVRPTLEALADSQRRNVAGGYFGGHYYLSYSTGGAQNDRTLDLDLQLGSWWQHSLAADDWAISEPAVGQRLYVAKAGVAAVVEAFADGTFQDSGQSYLSKWTGPFLAFGAPQLRKRCREMHFDGQGTVDLYVARDFATAPSFVKTVVFPADSSTFGGTGTFGGAGTFGGSPTVQEDRAFTLGVGRAWSVEFQQQDDEAFEIDSFTMAMQSRRD